MEGTGSVSDYGLKGFSWDKLIVNFNKTALRRKYIYISVKCGVSKGMNYKINSG